MLKPLLYLHRLPDEIPTHLNAAGTPDDYGAKTSLWLLPAFGAGVYALLTISVWYPHTFNYPVKITEDNAARQYLIAARMIRMLKAGIIALFAYITYNMIATTLGKAQGLGKAFFFVFLDIIFLPTGYYLVKAMRKK